MEKSLSKSKVLKLVGDSLKAARLKKEISQEDLADRANISRNYYNSVENGHRNIAILNLIKIVTALELESMDEIILISAIKPLIGGANA